MGTNHISLERFVSGAVNWVRRWVFSERELTFTLAICYRRSVCLSVCLSVTLVHPTQPVEIFRNFSSPFGTLAIHWHPRKILRRSSQGNTSVGGSKRKRGSQIWRFLANALRYVRYMLLQIRLSVVCLFVTLVHPTQPVEIFSNFCHHK